jgi:hypothetical protein
MSDNAVSPVIDTASANPNEQWRNYTKNVAIAACVLTSQDLQRLYRIINEKQIELGETLINGAYSQLPNETVEQFQQRRRTGKDAFITTVTFTGANGERVTGHGESIFNSGLLPGRIESILYDTAFSPKALLNYTPANRATILLDFSRPPLLNFVAQPSAPTANNSNWFVTGDTEAWTTSVSTRIADFFADKKTQVNWLHQSATYDWLLVLFGFPFSLWGAHRLGDVSTKLGTLPAVLSTALYIYAFILALNVFRALFSYARWVFPKIELETERSTVGKHRLIWSALVIGVLGGAVWDFMKMLLG